MTKLIFIGERFYSESGSSMSSLYEEETMKRYDWGFVQRDLRNGVTVTIRPALENEMEWAEEKLKGIEGIAEIQ